MAKTRVVLAGAGKIGEAIVALLVPTGDYEVTIVEQDAARLEAFAAQGLRTVACEIGDVAALAPVLAGHHAVISACPYYLTPTVARAALEAGVHYFDLTEDVESTRVVKRLAEGARTAFVPQCGLAPGFISIAAYGAAKGFDRLRDVRMRVGALPIFPSNALKYNLTWSTDGLINEYCNPCEAIFDGVQREVPALEQVEEFSLDGVQYEAFNTSGGLGTLCETLAGRVENLDYKTVRYPGHRDIVKMLVRDLRLAQNRGVLKDVFEAAIPMTTQDVVLVFVTVTGWKGGRLTQETFVRKVYAGRVHGKLLSAIQLTTAAGICAMVDLHRDGKLPAKGFVRQEQASLEDFLANRFGRHYAGEGNNHSESANDASPARHAA
ncbi:MAG: saccharopine dehydrogenase NADP-binding domain-containing protein [Betaproteobacteria bacterium]|nr:saccharopine dehydrogenase NADP-binding domain-containing protein [Betaproteobacteria bacterium]